MPLLKNLTGWNRWHDLKTIRGGRAVPHAVLPRGLYPASEFRSQFRSFHKVWYYPWRMFGLKPFSEFLMWMAPPRKSGLTPVFDRLLKVIVNGIGNTILSGYGIGQIPPPPVCGFCVGDLYKEYQYFRVTLIRDGGDPGGGQYVIPGIGQIVGPIPIGGGGGRLSEIGINMTSSIFQRSRLERLYLHHGTVASYGKRTIVDGDSESEINVLGLDIGGSWSGGSFPSSNINIIHSNDDGTYSNIPVSINSVNEDFEFIIDDPSVEIAAGDFYEFDKVICIKDPYLLTGIYFGTEDGSESSQLRKLHLRREKLSQIVCQGVYNEFNESSEIETDDPDADWETPWGYLVSNADIANQYFYHWNTGHIPFPVGEELDEVIFKDTGGMSEAFDSEFTNSTLDLHITTDNRFYEDIVFTGFYILKGSGGIVPTDAGDGFYDSEELSWLWVKSDKYEESEIYQKVEDRYWNSPDFYTVEGWGDKGFSKRENGSMSDVDSWIEDEETNFLRVEISRGGDSKRNNWHSPILAREWIIQDGKYFKILAQPDGNVIDISLKDITNTYNLNTDSESYIFNQYGWFITEHYWGNSMNPLFQITETISVSGLEIKYKYTYPTSDTIYDPHSDGPEDEESNHSFYKRFKNDGASSGGASKAWKKFNGWMITGDSGNVLPIESVEFEGNTEVTVLLKESVGEMTRERLSSLFENGVVWMTFGKPYARTYPTTHGPQFDAEPNLLATTPVDFPDDTGYAPRQITMVEDAGRVVRDLAINLTSTSYTGIKLNINKELIIGICGGRWFGEEPNTYVGSSSEDYIQIDEAIAMPYNDNSYPLMITTRYGAQGTSCIYDNMNQTSWVVYNDVYTGRLTIRKGQLDFKENPVKIEVSCGKPSHTETAGSFPVTLNKSYDRVKLMDMEVPESDTVYNFFTMGTGNNYHGFLISADGDLKLSCLNSSGELGDVVVEDYKYNSFYCSPVYLYNVNKYNRKSNQTLYIGMDSEDGPVDIEGDNPSNISIEYVNNSQTIQGDGYIDIHHTSWGEMAIVYSKPVFAFKLDGEVNNSSDMDNEWRNKNCVHVLSTLDYGRNWGCPVTNKSNLNPDKYQWPVMVLNSVNYKFSLYNQISRVLTIFCECVRFVDLETVDEIQRPFLAAFKIPVSSLAYKTVECTPYPDGGDYKFLFRAPRLSEEQAEWTDDEFKPVGGDVPSSDLIDRFVKIIGHPDTESQIADENINYGNINGFINDQGIYNLLLDLDGGIGLIFSPNSGSTWQKSEIRLAKEASSGVVIGRYLFYITVNGIESKLIDDAYIQNAYKCIEGVDEDFIEETQREFDEAPSFVVIGGNINPQRLTGYEDNKGFGYLFYYNSSGILTSLKSNNFKVWEFADNF